MITIYNKRGAFFTTATIYVHGHRFTTVRSIGDITREDLTEYLNSIFEDSCFIIHRGETSMILNDSNIDLGNGVDIELYSREWHVGCDEYEERGGYYIDCHSMEEWEYAVKQALKLSKAMTK
jgi:hypothetical protein